MDVFNYSVMEKCLFENMTTNHGQIPVISLSTSNSKEPSQHRVKRWGFSIDEVLKDPVGRDQFLRFLESEFSSENLR